MITHWPEFMQRKNPLIKEQYRLAINFFKIVGVPVGKQPGESWSDYITRTSKQVEVAP